RWPAPARARNASAVSSARPAPSRLFSQNATPTAATAPARRTPRPLFQARRKSVSASAVAVVAAVSGVPERAIHQYSGAVASTSAAIPLLPPTARAKTAVTATPRGSSARRAGLFALQRDRHGTSRQASFAHAADRQLAARKSCGFIAEAYEARACLHPVEQRVQHREVPAALELGVDGVHVEHVGADEARVVVRELLRVAAHVAVRLVEGRKGSGDLGDPKHLSARRGPVRIRPTRIAPDRETRLVPACEA